MIMSVKKFPTQPRAKNNVTKPGGCGRPVKERRKCHLDYRIWEKRWIGHSIRLEHENSSILFSVTICAKGWCFFALYLWFCDIRKTPERF